MSELALVVTLPTWQWLPGMEDALGWVAQRDGVDIVWVHPNGERSWSSVGRLPNLHSAGTQGCIAFVLLPKAWGLQGKVTVNVSEGYVEVVTSNFSYENTTYKWDHGLLGDNLIAALFAAPNAYG